MIPHIFQILKLLNEDLKDFKDIGPRMRVIFILQYLVYSEERDENESELTFNHILVNYTFSMSASINLKFTGKE